MTTAITGASGRLGRRVAELLLDQGERDLLLLTRTPDRLTDLAGRGARVEKASFANPTGLKQLLAGVERMLMISTHEIGRRGDLHRQAVAAARDAGVAHIFYTSVVQPSSDNPAVLVPEHALTEQAIRDSGMAWTLLRNNLYAELPVAQAGGQVQVGSLVTNAGDGATAYVSREDCARAAAAALSTDGHEKEIYDITGPEALTQWQLAARISAVAGKPVLCVQLDDEKYAEVLAGAGLPPEGVELITSIGVATREGFFGKVSDDFTALTGLEPVGVDSLLQAALTG